MTLIAKTAEALYLTATAKMDDPTPYELVSAEIKEEFEQMAIAALTVAFREPLILEDVSGCR